ncbi:hypothetical protein BURK2_02453 [Burkholderiales bacterium]|nr:MAG: DUF4124 domain-containing protein [Burkholderiales bacterium]CAG0992187.1 hypothetical protein BURK2_02453 [Burkholderiales bacterium]
MKRLVLMILLAASGSALAAGLYKWVDETGKVVYSDTPPPASAKESKRIAGAPPPADPGASKALGAVREKLQKGREAEAEQAKKDAEEASRQAENQANCTQWRGELAALERGSLGARLDEKGNRVLLDDKQLARRKADLQRWISDTCKG